MKNIEIWEGGVSGYSLLDSGNGEKLEEIAGTRIKRKEPRAWWKRNFGDIEWKNTKAELEEVLDLEDFGIKCKIKFKQSSKHIGIFPEQSAEWKRIADRISNTKVLDSKKIKVLNLFGYTGVASLVAAKNGAEVTHIDASKQSVDWAKENQKLSGLESAPIRWIVDDVLKFLKREVKRGEKYDAIIMDPPSYGKGPKGEVWKIEEELPKLFEICRELLSENPIFVILNMYSTELSSVSVGNLLGDMMNGRGGKIETGELVIPQQNSDKLLPMSIFAIWEK